jgi:chromosome segregation ATPase
MRQKTALFFLIALLASGVAVSRSQAPESPSILPALLTEVRGLRAAMEQMASAGPRVQLALGRLQLQEQRLSMLLMKQDATRGSLAGTQQQLAQHQGRLADLEENKESPNADVRRQTEEMITAIKREIATTSSEVQRLIAEESSISAEVASEQARWNELNQRLEELERTLGRR